MDVLARASGVLSEAAALGGCSFWDVRCQEMYAKGMYALDVRQDSIRKYARKSGKYAGLHYDMVRSECVQTCVSFWKCAI